MGNYHISIRGVGPHHNQGKDYDADKLARDLMNQLLQAGHGIKHAAITHGNDEDLLAEKVLASQNPEATK